MDALCSLHVTNRGPWTDATRDPKSCMRTMITSGPSRPPSPQDLSGAAFLHMVLLAVEAASALYLISSSWTGNATLVWLIPAAVTHVAVSRAWVKRTQNRAWLVPLVHLGAALLAAMAALAIAGLLWPMFYRGPWM